MTQIENPKSRVDDDSDAQAMARLEAMFREMPHNVPLVLFSSPGKNDVFCDAARQVIRTVRNFAPRVDFREFDLNHREAEKWNATRSPTLLFDPENFRIRWLGAPAGEEGKTFVEAVAMLGFRQTRLSPESSKVLAGIDTPRHTKVFVSPACPYCPQQAVNAIKAAIERPDIISLDIIDIQANPDLADTYAAQSVPQTFAN